MNYYCPECHHKIENKNSSNNFYKCQRCGFKYEIYNRYFIFDSSEMVNQKNYNLDTKILDIENNQLLRRLENYLLNILGSIKQKKILIIGCGGGADTIKLNQLGANAYGMDFRYRLSFWEHHRYPNSSLFISSIDKIPFPKSYFDYILCFGVIEHVYEDLYFSGEIELMTQKREIFLKRVMKV